jgi:hypothetical protein
MTTPRLVVGIKGVDVRACGKSIACFAKVTITSRGE